MPEVTQRALLTAVTVNSNGPSVDVRDMSNYSAAITATGGTSASIAFEGTAHPGGVGFAAIAFRQQGGGAYATTANSIAAGATESYFFDPADNLLWIRAVVSAQSGPTSLTGYLTGEK